MPKSNTAPFLQPSHTFVELLSKALSELRDHGQRTLIWDSYRETISLAASLTLCDQKGLSNETKEQLQAFMYGIAGVDPTKSAYKQPASAYEQFGHIAAPVLSAVDRLARNSKGLD